MLGGFGALAMISEGDEIVRAHHVQDPAVEVGEEIATALAARYDVAVHHPVEVSDSDDVRGLTQRPTDWDNYRVGLSLVVMLIDADTGSTLAAADCAYWPEYDDSDQAPTRPPAGRQRRRPEGGTQEGRQLLHAKVPERDLRLG